MFYRCRMILISYSHRGLIIPILLIVILLRHAFNAQMDLFLMRRHIVPFSRAIIAHLTLVRFLARVRPLVLAQALL